MFSFKSFWFLPTVYVVACHSQCFSTAYTDYNITMADITIPAFTTSTDFTVGIITDNIVEGDEVFRAVIVGAAADEEPLPVSQPQSEVTIVDDDGE